VIKSKDLNVAAIELMVVPLSDDLVQIGLSLEINESDTTGLVLLVVEEVNLGDSQRGLAEEASKLLLGGLPVEVNELGGEEGLLLLLLLLFSLDARSRGLVGGRGVGLLETGVFFLGNIGVDFVGPRSDILNCSRLLAY